MYHNTRQIGFGEKLAEITGYAIRVDGMSIWLCEEAICIYPTVTHFETLFKLPCPILLENDEGLCRQFDCSIGHYNSPLLIILR